MNLIETPKIKHQIRQLRNRATDLQAQIRHMLRVDEDILPEPSQKTLNGLLDELDALDF